MFWTLSYFQAWFFNKIQWCCVTELEVPSSGTSSNIDGTGTKLDHFQRGGTYWNGTRPKKRKFQLHYIWKNAWKAVHLTTSMCKIFEFLIILPYHSYFWGAQLRKNFLQPTFCSESHIQNTKNVELLRTFLHFAGPELKRNGTSYFCQSWNL